MHAFRSLFAALIIGITSIHCHVNFQLGLQDVSPLEITFHLLEVQWHLHNAIGMPSHLKHLTPVLKCILPLERLWCLSFRVDSNVHASGVEEIQVKCQHDSPLFNLYFNSIVVINLEDNWANLALSQRLLSQMLSLYESYTFFSIRIINE